MKPSVMQISNDKRPLPLSVHFLLVSGFTHLALSSSIEVLRVANLLSGQTLYTWSLMTPGGERQQSSNGLVTLVDTDLINLRPSTELYVVSGLDVESETDARIGPYLRQQQRHGVLLGAICSGAYVLADAGLLAGKSCALHWEYHSLFREKFPDIDLTQEVFAAQQRPFTASGGTAGAELMLELVARSYGVAFSREIADQLVLPSVRSEGDLQRMPNHIRYNTRNSILLLALDLMDANIEEPLTPTEIANSIGVSVRQIERLFRKHLGHSPARHYKRLRLEHARKLLKTSDLSILQVALASGFVSASHFSKMFRSEFGVTPYFYATENEQPR